MSQQSRINKAYLKAAYRNDLAKLQTALTEVRLNFWHNAVLPRAEIVAHDSQGRNAIMLAALAGNLQIVTYVADLRINGASIDLLAVDREGNNVLHYACKSGNVDVIAYLLQRLLPIDQANRQGTTPLTASIKAEHAHLVDMLIEHGADMNKADSEGNGPLHYGANTRQFSIIEKLVAKGVNLNQVNNKGYTILHCLLIERSRTEDSATRRFCEKAIKLIVEKGANLDISNNEGHKLRDDRFISKIISPPKSSSGILSNLLGLSSKDPAEIEKPITQTVLETVLENKTLENSKVREAFANEGLDPDADEQWRPIGQSAIEHVIGNASNPRVIITTFNFVARQTTSQTRNLLTAESMANTSDAMDSHPSPSYVEQAHAELLKAGKTPPALWPHGMPIGAKKLQLAPKI